MPGLSPAHTNLGNVYRAMGRFDDALASYRRAIELDPNQALPWNNIGRVEQQFGRYEAAFAAFEKALALEPGVARLHANLASLLSDQDRHEAAVERFQLVLGCEPDHAESFHGMAVSLIFLGRRDEAWTVLETAIRLRPRLIPPRTTKARMLAEDGDFEGSNAVAREVLAQFPKAADGRFHLAMNLRAKLPDEDFREMVELMDHPYYGDDAIASLAFGIGTVHDREDPTRMPPGTSRSPTSDRPRSWPGEASPSTPSEMPRRSRRYRLVHPRVLPDAPGSRQSQPASHLHRGDAVLGTTLTEQVIASHPRVFGAGELDDVSRLVTQLAAPSDGPVGGPTHVAKKALEMDAAAFRSLADRHIARLEALGGPAEHVVDKMPSNLMHLGLIAALWPGRRSSSAGGTLAISRCRAGRPTSGRCDGPTTFAWWPNRSSTTTG